MGALMLLVLAASDLVPPPAVEAPVPGAYAAPDWAQEPEEVAKPRAAGDAPEWDLGAQLSLSLLHTLNGTYLGIAACGAVACYSNSAFPMVFGMVGAGTAFTLSVLDQEPARGWGRAAFVDSAILGGGLLSLFLATQTLHLGEQIGYSAIFLSDLAVTAGAVMLSRYVTPRPETVLLADTLGLWGLVLGAAALTLVQGNPFNDNQGTFILGGAVAGLATGALMGLSAQRMSGWRVLLANAAALVGALVLGGGLSLYESSVASPQRPYDPAVPAAGLAAGIAGGFLLGFVFSEPL